MSSKHIYDFYHRRSTSPDKFQKSSGSRNSHKKGCVYHFGPKPRPNQFLEQVRAALHANSLGDVLVGWEHSFLLPEDSYIVCFENGHTAWLNYPAMTSVLTEVIVVSTAKVIVKTKPEISTENLKQVMVSVNRTHGASIRKLLGYDGRQIWQENAQYMQKAVSKDTSTSMEMNLQNAPAKAYKQPVTTLLSTAQANMAGLGL